MRVLLVDDHFLMLEGLRNLLAARGFDVVGTASDGLQALEAARALQPDVVLMDIQMPNWDGLEATRRIKAEMPDMRVVILTMSGDDQHLFDAIQLGVSGYILKNADADEFYQLLDDISRGKTVIMPQLAGKLMAEFARRAQAGDAEVAPQMDALPRPSVNADDDRAANRAPRDVLGEPTGDTVTDAAEELTVRQREVLALVGQGCTNREIAERLVITERTVKFHVSEILQKLRLRNRAQIVAYSLAHPRRDSR